jgi:hypothetical protein
MRLRPAPIAILIVSSLVACNSADDLFPRDQTETAHFRVANQSSEAVVVAWGQKRAYDPYAPVDVPASSTRTLLTYQTFLAPPPDPAYVFTCLSVYRASDQTLLFQLAPVINSQWTHRSLGKFEADYTLVLADAMFNPSLQNGCSELTGTAIDSVTTTALEDYNVTVFVAGSSEDYELRTGPGKTEYSFMWAGDLPVGSIQFAKSPFSSNGYDLRIYSLPGDATDLGGRHYELDATLKPRNLP